MSKAVPIGNFTDMLMRYKMNPTTKIPTPRKIPLTMYIHSSIEGKGENPLPHSPPNSNYGV
jgi:hypothetical protein